VLLDHAETADLLVLGSRGRGGIRSTMLGSVALHCASHAACPVVVVHPAREVAGGEPSAAPRVVVGVDDSGHATAALVAAVAEARRRGARVEAVLAYRLPDYWSEVYAGMTPPPEETRASALERAQAVVTDALGAGADAVDVTVAEGRAGEVLVQQAPGADLLVVGSRSRSTVPGMVLGSVALHSMIHAPCPVMVVRPRRNATGSRPSAAAEPATLG